MSFGCFCGVFQATNGLRQFPELDGPSRIVGSSDLRSSCSEPTFTPAPGDDKVWKYADGTAKGTDVGIPFFESSDGSDFFAIFGVTPKKAIIYR